jgi:hypothetical protein
LYFDLDVVVTGSLSWITGCRTDYFWALKDQIEAVAPIQTEMEGLLNG